MQPKQNNSSKVLDETSSNSGSNLSNLTFIKPLKRLGTVLPPMNVLDKIKEEEND